MQVELELTKPPESLRTYNGNIREESKTKFVVTPPSYGREVAPGANIQFQLHMTFTRGSTAPQVRLQLDVVLHCMYLSFHAVVTCVADDHNR